MIFGTIAADRKHPTVATSDIAAVAARLLLDDTCTGQEAVPVLGPEDLSGNDMAAIISKVPGTPVRFQQIPGQAFKDQLTGFGVSDAMAQGMLDMMIAKDNGLDNGIARTPQNAIDTPTGVAALGADGCPALLEVEFFDAEGEDLAGAGGGLVQHPPQRLSPQRDVAAGRQLLDPGAGQRPGGVAVLGVPLHIAGQLGGRPAFLLAHQFSQDTTAARLRFHVAGARLPHKRRSAAAISSPGTAASGRCGPSSAARRSITPA